MTNLYLPRAVAAPRIVQTAAVVAQPRRSMRWMRERYGTAYRAEIPPYGYAVVLSDPDEVHEMFTTRPEQLDNIDINLGRVLGTNSFFALSGQPHKRQRKLLVPPFHGRRLGAYERIVEEETLREIATWRHGHEFPVIDATMRITINVITLLAAGHETTATTLAWAVERLRRHPELLARLSADLDAGGTDLLAATITEVQRVRTVIDIALRQVRAEELTLGRWTLPRGQLVIAGIGLIHEDPAVFPNPGVFDPDRFLGSRLDTQKWIPFGGGARRCIGAAFAQMELNVVLRTLLRELEIVPTKAADEKWHSRGVAMAPAGGGRIEVQSRATRFAAVPESVAAEESA